MQLDKDRKVEMVGLSRAYGFLLQFCGIKTQKETVPRFVMRLVMHGTMLCSLLVAL